jgi:hypothetical protein
MQRNYSFHVNKRRFNKLGESREESGVRRKKTESPETREKSSKGSKVKKFKVGRQW